MKVSIILFLAATILHCITSSDQEPQDQTGTCPQNPFLPELRSYGVHTFSNWIKTNISSCGIEWNTFGFCCNQSDLLAYAKDDTKNISKAVLNVSATFNKFVQALNTILNWANEIRKEEMNLFRSDLNRFYFIDFFRQKETLSFRNRLINKNQNETFSKIMRSCWAKIATSRSNSLCSVCSGRSGVFFSNRKILMAYSDCSAILSECVPAFKILVELLDNIGTFLIKFINALSSYSEMISKKLSDQKILIKQIRNLQLQVEIDKYLSQANSTDPRTAANLCQRFLNIRGPTFIEQIQPIFANFDLRIHERKMRTISRYVIKNRNSASSNFKEKNPQKRRLQGLAQGPLGSPFVVDNSSSLINESKLSKLESLFVGDVMVVQKNVDSSYTSYYGSTGTTVETHISRIPFNISNIFP